MLEIVNYNQDEYEFPCLLVLGCFDGMHAGHAELLKKAKLQAKINGLDLGVMMFSEGKGGKQVYTFEERLKFLEPYNVKFVLKIDFNDDFKATAPLDFLHVLEDKLNVKAYMSGKDFRFGAGAKGKSSTLKSYAEDEENGVWYMPVKDLTVNDVKVSTSEIKKLLESGDLAQANELLGRSFAVYGIAEAGENGAISLNYPANKVEIKHGVYAVKCTVDGTEYTGTAEFGNGLTVCLENLGEDISGKEIAVEFTGLNEASEQAAELAVADTEAAEEAPTETPADVAEALPETQVETAEEEQVPLEATAEDEAFEEELGEDFSEEAETVEEPPAAEETATVEETIVEEPAQETPVEEQETNEENVEEAAAEEPAVEEVPEEQTETVVEEIQQAEEAVTLEEVQTDAEEEYEAVPAEVIEATEEEPEVTEAIEEPQAEDIQQNDENQQGEDTQPNEDNQQGDDNQ